MIKAIVTQLNNLFITCMKFCTKICTLNKTISVVYVYVWKSSLVHPADLCRAGVRVWVRVSSISRATVRVRAV